MLYLAGIALAALVAPWAGLVFGLVALMWLIHDTRVERYLASRAA